MKNRINGVEFTGKIIKMDNNLGVIIPDEIIKKLDLKENDFVRLKILRANDKFVK